MELKKDSLITLKIETLAYGGRGIGKWEGIVTFVPHTVPGDTVQARITKNKGNYIEAELVEVVTPSPVRVTPPCKVFGPCGGCVWQCLPYETQLAYKEELSRSVVEHLARQHEFTHHPIIPSPVIWRYRNKMDYTFGADENGRPILGFHKKGSFTEVIDIETCHLQPEIFDRLLREMRSFAQEKSLVPYNPVTHKGLLRHFMLRCATNTPAGEPMPILAALLTGAPELPRRDELLERLRRTCPSLKGFIHGLNVGLGDVMRMNKLLFKWGNDFLEERVCDLELCISAFSFFQTNTKAAELLYEKTREFLSLTGQETLLDAYCGTGSIGLLCARQTAQVFGIEVMREAIWDARYNAQRNGLTNCIFLCGEMRKCLGLVRERLPLGVQRMVVDPPRNGLDKKSLRQIIELNAPLLVYVSCNPTTMARDAAVISEAGYRITDIQPLDMFPHTYHFEMVGRFEKIGFTTETQRTQRINIRS